MFDKLEDLVRRFEEITNELTEPSVVNDQNRFRKLMKEQSDLQPLVDAYTEYRKCQETVEDSLAMLESESDDEMRWRRDGAEGVVSYNADAAYIYCRSDGSGVSFVLLLLNSSLLLII